MHVCIFFKRKNINPVLGVFSPTSLCGVLVFRLAPAAPLPLPLPRPPAAASLTHLTHHTSFITALLITPLVNLTHHSTTHHTCGRRSTQSLLEELVRAWAPAGPRLAFVWQAQYTEPSGGAGARVGASWPAAGFRVAGAVHRAFWTSWCVRGRRWSAAGFHVAGAVHRAFWRSWCGRLCVLRLPHESQPRASWRPRAHQLLQKALCTAPAT